MKTRWIPSKLLCACTMAVAIVLLPPMAGAHPPAFTSEVWIAQAPLLIGREGAAGAFVNGAFIMSHGFTPVTGDSTDAFLILPGGAQLPLPSAFVPRSELVGAVAQVGPNPVRDARFFAIGGRGPLCVAGVCDTVEIFNPTTLTWGFGAATIGNLIYVVGGRTGFIPYTGAPLATMEIYDPVANAWVAGPPLPIPVMDVYSTTAIGCDLFVIGGFDGISEIAAVQMYDTCTGIWSLLAPMPTPRSNAIAGVCGGHIYVIGGTILGGLDVATVEEFEPTPGPGTWAPAPPLPLPASELAAGAVAWPATSPAFPGVIMAVGTGIFGAAGVQDFLLACTP